MEVNKLSRDMVRGIKVGERAVFFLPAINACYSARNTVTQVGQLMNRKYKCHVVKEDLSVAITRTK